MAQISMCYTLRTDVKGRKSYVKDCHAADRTIAQLKAAVGQRKVTPFVLLHFSPFVQQFHRNWTKSFFDHAVFNFNEKIQIFCYKMLVLGNKQISKLKRTWQLGDLAKFVQVKVSNALYDLWMLLVSKRIIEDPRGLLEIQSKHINYTLTPLYPLKNVETMSEIGQHFDIHKC